MIKISSFLKKLLFWEVLFLFIFIPLYPKFPLLNVSKTFVAIRVEDLFILFAALTWGLYILTSKRVFELFKDRLFLAVLLFFWIGLLSLFSGLFITNTVVPHLGALHFLRRIEFIILLFVAVSAITSLKHVKVILITLAVVTVLVNVYALGQHYLSWPVISTTNSEFSKGLILHLTPGARVNSTFAGHYDLAVFLMMVIVMATAIIFAFKRIELWGLSIILTIFSFLILVMTAARLSFVAAAFGVFLNIILSGKKKLILVLMAVVILAVSYPSQLRDRFISTITVNIQQEGVRYDPTNKHQRNRSQLNIPTLPVYVSSTSAQAQKFATESGIASDITPGEPTDTTDLGVYRSFEIRLNIEWPNAIRAFTKNPFLGTGYSSLGIATDNDFLRSLGEAGILGTISFGLVIIEIVKRIWGNFCSQNRLIKFFSLGVLSLIVSFILNGLFIDVFESSKVASLFWMIVGTNLALLNTKND